MSDHEKSMSKRDVEGVTLQLARAFAAFNKSADKLSTAYKQLIAKEDAQIAPYSHSLAMLEDRNLLLGALKSMSDGVIIVDHECRIAFLNAEAKELTGLSNCYASDGLYPDVFKETIETAIPGRCRKHPSPGVEVEIYTTPIADDSRNIIGAVGIVTSLTGKDIQRNKAPLNIPIKNPENSIHKAQPSTIAPVFTAIGDIIINIAHQMRSPLSAIQLFAELLKQDLDADKHEMIDDILVGVNSLDAVLSNLLSFSQPVNPDFQEVDIIAILEESLLFAKHAMKQQNISLTKEYSHTELCCRGDLEQLKQVCYNLILNAIQAMPEGGKLRVKASFIDESGAEHIDEYNNGYINVEIADNGLGIPDGVMERIFIPFFTTKEGGTGLGLCIVYRLMQAHDGSIQINSNFGYGTTATIQLPTNKAKNSTKSSKSTKS